jgi:tetratricopeptide (TPR) repeat protein
LTNMLWEFNRRFRTSTTDNTDDALRLGRLITDELIGEEVEGRIATRADQSTGGRLRIALSVDGALSSIPWELMTIAGQPLALRDNVTIVRLATATSTARPGPASVITTGALAVMFAMPEGADLLDVEGETARVISEIENSGADPASVFVLSRGTLSCLREELGQTPASVLHVSCHANTGALAIEDDSGYVAATSADEFAAALGSRPPSVIVLSGCLTGQSEAPLGKSPLEYVLDSDADGDLEVQQELARLEHQRLLESPHESLAEAICLASGATVVAMTRPVTDHYAVRFGATLIGLLAAEGTGHLTAVDAVALARQTLQAAAPASDPIRREWFVPTVYTPPVGAEPESASYCRFVASPDGSAPTARLHEQGIFRFHHVRRIERSLEGRGGRLVNVTGPIGSGKTFAIRQVLDRIPGVTVHSVSVRTFDDVPGLIENGRTLGGIGLPGREICHIECTQAETVSPADASWLGRLREYLDTAPTTTVILETRRPLRHLPPETAIHRVGPFSFAEARKFALTAPVLRRLPRPSLTALFEHTARLPGILALVDYLLSSGDEPYSDEKRSVAAYCAKAGLDAEVLKAATAEAGVRRATDVALRVTRSNVHASFQAESVGDGKSRVLLGLAIARGAADDDYCAIQLIDLQEPTDADASVQKTVEEWHRWADLHGTDISRLGDSAIEKEELFRAYDAFEGIPTAALDRSRGLVEDIRTSLIDEFAVLLDDEDRLVIAPWLRDEVIDEYASELPAAHRRAAAYWGRLSRTSPTSVSATCLRELERGYHFGAAGDVLVKALLYSLTANTYRRLGAVALAESVLQRALAPDLDGSVQADLLLEIGLCEYARGQNEAGMRHHAEAADLMSAEGSPESVRAAVRLCGNVAAKAGKPEALDLFRQFLRMCRQEDDIAGEAAALHLVGLELEKKMLLDEAEDSFRAAEALKRSSGDEKSLGTTVHEIGNVRVHRGDAEGARTAYLEAIRLGKMFHDRRGMALATEGLALALVLAGDFTGATATARGALVAYEEADDPVGVLRCLTTMGMAAYGSQNDAFAVDLLERAAAIAKGLGAWAELEQALGWLMDATVELGRVEEAFIAYAPAVRAPSDGSAWTPPQGRPDLMRFLELLGPGELKHQAKQHWNVVLSDEIVASLKNKLTKRQARAALAAVLEGSAEGQVFTRLALLSSCGLIQLDSLQSLRAFWSQEENDEVVLNRLERALTFRDSFPTRVGQLVNVASEPPPNLAPGLIRLLQSGPPVAFGSPDWWRSLPPTASVPAETAFHIGFAAFHHGEYLVAARYLADPRIAAFPRLRRSGNNVFRFEYVYWDDPLKQLEALLAGLRLGRDPAVLEMAIRTMRMTSDERRGQVELIRQSESRALPHWRYVLSWLLALEGEDGAEQQLAAAAESGYPPAVLTAALDRWWTGHTEEAVTALDAASSAGNWGVLSALARMKLRGSSADALPKLQAEILRLQKGWIDKAEWYLWGE